MATFGWPDNNLTVPEDVRRLWDSERMEFSDDDPCVLWDQVDGVLIPDMDLPDHDDGNDWASCADCPECDDCGDYPDCPDDDYDQGV